MAARKSRDPFEVVIDTLHEDGYGVADEERVGVTGALPGERVVAQPFTRKKRRLFARTQSVLEPHADRVSPICAVAGWCGGCSLQHLDPGAQIAGKQARLAEALGDVQPASWLPPLTGPVSGYRSKARLAVKYVKAKERVLVGFREKMQPFVTDMSRCEVLVEPFGALIEPLAELIASLSIAAALPQIEVAVGDDRGALVFRHLEPLTDSDAEALVSFSNEHDIDVYLQPGGIDTVHKLAPAGEQDRLHYRLDEYDIDMAFHPMDFTQVNQSINRKLVDLALGLLDVDDTHHVLDLFCGIGNFTLPLARRAASVHGVELSETSVERARENARRNDIHNVTFAAGDLFDAPLILDGLADRVTPDRVTPDRVALDRVTPDRVAPDRVTPDRVTPDRVLLDPPRSGAAAVCQVLASRKVQRVVYVSCNPATLASDVRVLTERGYRLEYAGVIDMFPHTTHVESIACLS